MYNLELEEFKGWLNEDPNRKNRTDWEAIFNAPEEIQQRIWKSAVRGGNTDNLSPEAKIAVLTIKEFLAERRGGKQKIIWQQAKND